MSEKFARRLIQLLDQSDRYHLAAVVEPTLVSAENLEIVRRHWHPRPLLIQPEFDNLREYGPMLCSARPGSKREHQSDFIQYLFDYGGDGVVGWIISLLPAAQLANHLALANRVLAPDGHRYLLRYHTPRSVEVLQTCTHLPSVQAWIAPIHTWWVPQAESGTITWVCRQRQARMPDSVGPLELDQASWDNLIGDPLEYRLADQLANALAQAKRPARCHVIRLSMARQRIAEARAFGITDQKMTALYTTSAAIHPHAFDEASGWPQALAEMEKDSARFTSAFAAQLRQHVKQGQPHG